MTTIRLTTAIVVIAALATLASAGKNDGTCKVKVNFLGLRGVDVILRDENGDTVETVNNAKNKATFRIPHSTTYTAELKHGGATRTVNVECRNGKKDARITGNVCSLTARFRGIKADVHVSSGTGADRVTRTWSKRNGKKTVNVLRDGTYDVRMEHHRASGVFKEETVACDSKKVTIDAKTTKLTARFPHIKDAEVSIWRADANGAKQELIVTSPPRKHNWKVWVFDDEYAIDVTKHAVTKTLFTKCANGETGDDDDDDDDKDHSKKCKAERFSAKLQMRFPGVKLSELTVKDLSGNVHWTKSNVKNGKNAWLVRGMYTVTMVDKNGDSETHNVDCTGTTCKLENLTAKMVIKFHGVRDADVEVKNGVTGDVVASKTGRNGQWTTRVLRHNDYDVSVTKNGFTYTVSGVDCDMRKCIVSGFTSKVRVKFHGVRGVDVNAVSTGTSNVQNSRSSRNGGVRFHVLKQALDVTVSKSGVDVARTNVDCTSDCLIDDVTSRMKLRFRGAKDVDVAVTRTDADGAAAVASRTGRRGGWHLWVLRGTYKATLQWKGQTHVLSSIDCTGAQCDHQEQMTSKLRIRYHGVKGAAVEIKDSADTVVHSKASKNHALHRWVFKGTYQVTVSKDGVSVSRSVDCDDGDNYCVVKDLTVRMRIRFPGLRKVKVTFSANGQVVRQASRRNGGWTLRMLRHNDYDVKVEHKGAEWSMTGLDADKARVLLRGFSGRMKVWFRGERGVKVEVFTPAGDLVVSRKNRRNAFSRRLLCGTYVVHLNGVEHSTQTVPCNVAQVDVEAPTEQPEIIEVEKPVDSLPAPTTPAVTDAKSIAFTGLEGVPNVAVECRHQETNDEFFRSPALATDLSLAQQTPAGTWDRNVTQGNVLVEDTFTTTADADYTEDLSALFAELTLNLGSEIGNVTIDVLDDEGDELVSLEGVSGVSTVKVLKGIYDVVVHEGAANVTIPAIDCTSGTCAVAEADALCLLTVEHTGLNVTGIALSFDGELSDVMEGEDEDSTTFLALQGTYDLVVESNSAKYEGEVTCNSATGTVSNLMTTMTITHNGVEGVEASIDLDDGVVADYDGLSGSTDIALLRNSAYDVDLKTGSNALSFDNIDCSGASCTVAAGADLTVTATSLSNLFVSATPQSPYGSGTVIASTATFDASSTLKLMRGVYDVAVRDLGDSEENLEVLTSSVDCTSGTCAVTGLENTATVNFDGLTGVTVTVSADVSGDVLTVFEDQDNQATATLLKTAGYAVTAAWKGVNTTVSAVDLSGAAIALDFACTVDIKFPNRDEVDVQIVDTLTGTIVGSSSNVTNSTDFALLADRDYTINLSGFGFPLGESRDLLACTGDMISEPPMDKEVAALEALYNTCGGDSWTRNDNWRFIRGERACNSATTSEFVGVYCRDWVVKEVEVDWNNLICDQLPEKLVDLEFLQLLNIEGNKVGALSDNFGLIDNLKHLYIGYNGMTGALPAQITDLGYSLQVFHAQGNKFSGSIPDAMNNLVYLKQLRLEHNELSGELPFLGNMTELVDVRLNDNMLSGDFPSWIGEWENVKQLDLHNNMFTGMLPDSVGELVHVEEINVANNNLSGNLPDLSDMTTLSNLNTEGNPEMKDSAVCTDDTDGTKTCSTVSNSEDDSAAGFAHPAVLLVAAAASAALLAL